jgi:hypothetical protein
MADLDSTNMRTFRPTSTERVKRFRQRGSCCGRFTPR